jgi:2'-5' RNA ligase
MRVFAAVLPPAEAADELARAVDRLRSLRDADVLRWTAQADWHFTLAFMGEVDDQLMPELSERLRHAALRTEPFPLRISGGGHFGGRTLWAGAAGGVDELRLLAERGDAAADRAGVPVEGHRRYEAHLTLAVSRTETDLSPYTDTLDSFGGTPWEVTDLALVRSNLPAAGASVGHPRYETVFRCPLGQR